MGNFNEQRQQREKREARERNSRDLLAKFFYDMAKTAFAVMVAGGIICLFDDTKNVLLVSCITILASYKPLLLPILRIKSLKRTGHASNHHILHHTYPYIRFYSVA